MVENIELLTIRRLRDLDHDSHFWDTHTYGEKIVILNSLVRRIDERIGVYREMLESKNMTKHSAELLIAELSTMKIELGVKP